MDKLFFAAGVFAGSQLPNFIQQYRQRIGGRLDQAREDFKTFQAIADRFHNGSIENLIQKHLSSTDTTFYHEGFAIKNIWEKTISLSESYKALDSSLASQIKHLFFNLDKEIALETWKIYKPGLILTSEAITCALLTGFIFSIVFYFLVKSCSALFKIFYHK